MVNVQRLQDLIEAIDQLSVEDVIFVRPEWSPDSDAAALALDEECRVPSTAEELGMTYFLGVETALEVLEEFQDQPEATVDEKCRRLIEYATFDA